LLVSSGLESSVAAGYPVAMVTGVVRDSGAAVCHCPRWHRPQCSTAPPLTCCWWFTDTRSPEQRVHQSARLRKALDRENSAAGNLLLRPPKPYGLVRAVQ
jgi:hypothetical protein